MAKKENMKFQLRTQDFIEKQYVWLPTKFTTEAQTSPAILQEMAVNFSLRNMIEINDDSNYLRSLFQLFVLGHLRINIYLQQRKYFGQNDMLVSLLQ